MRKSFILPIVSGALLLFATQHVMSRQQPSVQSPPPVEPAQAPFAQVLAGAGLVEAQTENLRIGSPLTGIVDRVFVKAYPMIALDTAMARVLAPVERVLGVTLLGTGAVRTIKFFNTTKGFGFITPDGGAKDVFVHISAVQAAGLATLKDGQVVTFDTEADRMGKGPKAVNIQAS